MEDTQQKCFADIRESTPEILIKQALLHHDEDWQPAIEECELSPTSSKATNNRHSRLSSDISEKSATDIHCKPAAYQVSGNLGDAEEQAANLLSDMLLCVEV
jgi:hypothetical protein